MTRLRANFEVGTITNNPLSSGATTINSASFSSLPVISSPDILVITLDPEGAAGLPEIAHITDHASSATSVTVLRGREGTLAREHLVDTEWVNALTAQDIDDLYATVAGYVPLAGGSMTGLLVLSGAPSLDLHAATKLYVDTLIAAVPTEWDDITDKPATFPPEVHVHDAGDIVSGVFAVGRIPTGTSASTVALGNHTHAGGSYLPLSGGTMTGAITTQSGASFADPGIRIAPGGPVIYNTGNVLYIGPDTASYLIGFNPDSNGVSPNSDGVVNLGVPGNTWNYVHSQRLYLINPLTTTNNGLPGWRHNTSASGNGWEVMRLVSSSKYKKHVSDWDTTIDLEKINELRVVKYKPKAGRTADDPNVWLTGLVAEEAAEVYPHLAVYDDDQVEGIAYDGLIIPLVSAVQALANRVTALESV